VISLPFPQSGFPWGTLLVNYIGSVFLLTVLLYSKHHVSAKWWWRPALGSGFCGGFTTYSAFALKMDQYFETGRTTTAVIYAVTSIIGTYILVFITHELLERKLLK
jgi:CrcB protein